MGIPRFFKLITEQFPNVSKQISFRQGFYGDGTPIVDNLYLDANGILHNCSREVYFGEIDAAKKRGYKPRLSRAPKKKILSPAEKELLTFQKIVQYMDQLLKFVKPEKLFYIAIDGPAPLAKQAQQRQRRYKAADEKTDEERRMFDSTAITPGTTFMYKLSTFIRYYIRKQMSTDPAWKKVKVIFSGPDTPGEGEHKIIQYIREQPDAKDLVHCMYGLDADLFMLSLSTHCEKFYLLREDQFNTVWNDTLFYKVDIGHLRKDFFSEWGTMGGSVEHIIDEFIFICFLVGNDFLHALPCCHDLSESITFLMELRKEKLGSSYITNKKGINLNNLVIFLTSVESIEKTSIEAQFHDQHFPNKTLNSSMVDPHNHHLGVDMQKYRELYYKKAGIDHSNVQQVWLFCKSYIQGLEWVQHYYHSKPKNWHWYYPYHYTPLISDILDYLTNASSSGGPKLTRVSTKVAPPILPFQQLLCVVPPKSKKLLPPYLRPLYNGMLKKYYPEKYDLDLEGKIKEWEAIAILPFIKLNDILVAYKKASEKATEKGLKINYERNKLAKATQYWYSANTPPYNYKCSYGAISKCKISYRKI